MRRIKFSPCCRQLAAIQVCENNLRKKQIMGSHFVMTHRNGAVFQSFLIPPCIYMIKLVCVALKVLSAGSKFHIFE